MDRSKPSCSVTWWLGWWHTYPLDSGFCLICLNLSICRDSWFLDRDELNLSSISLLRSLFCMHTNCMPIVVKYPRRGCFLNSKKIAQAQHLPKYLEGFGWRPLRNGFGNLKKGCTPGKSSHILPNGNFGTVFLEKCRLVPDMWSFPGDYHDTVDGRDPAPVDR